MPVDSEGRAKSGLISNVENLKGQTDENLNFEGWIYTLRGYSLRLKNFENCYGKRRITQEIMLYCL